MASGRRIWLILFPVFLAVAAIIVVGIVVYGGSALSGADSDRQDQEALSKIAQIYAGNASAGDKAKQIEAQLGFVRGQDAKAAQGRKLATLYNQVGKEILAEGHLTAPLDAERALNRGYQLDPANMEVIASLASLYFKVAKDEQTLPDRAKIYEKSIDWWKRAAAAAKSDAAARDRFLERAGEVYYAEANDYGSASKYDDADRVAREGIGVVPDGSPIKKKLEEFQFTIRRSR